MNSFKKVMALSIASMASLEAAEPIIPHPVEVELTAKSIGFQINQQTVITCTEELKEVASLLAKEIQADRGIQAKVVVGKQPKRNGIHLTLGGEGGAESYELESSKGSVVIKAKDASGSYYGTRTLLQYLQSGNGSVPSLNITDSPEFPVRSVLVDVGRKFMPVEELKDWIRMMGWFKLNELHLHLNDNSWGRYPGYRLESKKYPELSSKDGFYTFAQIRELQDFAKLRGITIVPEIDSPGHALAFTTLRPELAQQEMDRTGFGLAYLDLQNPEAIRFMEGIFDEVVPLFDAKEFHIGTDEYRLNLVKDKKEREALGEAFRQYINHCDEYLRTKHGKVTRIWSGYEHLPGKTEPNKTVVIDMWETSDAKVKSKAGYQVVNSSHHYTYIVPGAPYYGVNNTFIYNDWTPRQFSNKPEGKLEKSDPGLLGGKLHVWNDFGPTGYTWNEIARLTLPSMSAMAEKLWGTKGHSDYKSFTKNTQLTAAKVPVVELLDRKAAKNTIVWKQDKARTHIGNTSYPIDAEAANLEYPWTAHFTVTRYNDIAGNETLISSDLAAFYLDLTHTSLNKKTKQNVVERGVACVRANQAPGFDAITSYRPDVLVWDYQLPLNKEVNLTFVGERRKTSLYVDGTLVGVKNKQMVCPLEFIGDGKLPRGFHGVLHKASIKSSAPKNVELGEWNPTSVSNGELAYNLGDKVAVGEHTVSFDYTRGSHGIDIAEVSILENGKVIAKDSHAGFAGGTNRLSDYTLKIAKVKKGAKYTLKVKLKGAGGNDSNGTVKLR